MSIYLLIVHVPICFINHFTLGPARRQLVHLSSMTEDRETNRQKMSLQAEIKAAEGTIKDLHQMQATIGIVTIRVIFLFWVVFSQTALFQESSLTTQQVNNSLVSIVWDWVGPWIMTPDVFALLMAILFYVGKRYYLSLCAYWIVNSVNKREAKKLLQFEKDFARGCPNCGKKHTGACLANQTEQQKKSQEEQQQKDQKEKKKKAELAKKEERRRRNEEVVVSGGEREGSGEE